MTVFSGSDRERVRARVLEIATDDPRIVAGAVVGSLALDEGDRWSDLDLTFAVENNRSLLEVLADWTAKLVDEFDAAHLFDLPSGASIYRVFLLPGCLQFDLSFTPASKFGAIGPKFRMLFGSAVQKPFAQLPSPQELFGYAVHHAVRARFCIERGRFWQAEYWLSGARDYALSLACRVRNLPASHGRGFDDLPPGILDNYARGLATSLKRDELFRALRAVIESLLGDIDSLPEFATRIEPHLRLLARDWDA